MREVSPDVGFKNVLILHDAPLDEWKGTQRSLLEYGNMLTESGFRVTYVSPATFKRPDEAKITLKVEIKFKVLKLRLRRFVVYFVPRSVLSSLKHGLIYVSTFNTFPLIPIKSRKIIFGSFVYGPEHENVSGTLRKTKILIKKKIFQLSIRFYPPKSVCFHALNPTQAEWLKALTRNRFEVFTVPPPVDCSKYFYLEQPPLRDGKFNVLYLGPLTVEKGFADFASIVNEANSTDLSESIEFSVLSVGGPLWGLARELTKKWKNVHFYESSEEGEKIDFLRRNHILVSPSKVENFHFVTAEAQLCGLPAISSNISGPRSIIIQSQTGFLVPTGDIKGFVDKITEYLELWKSEPDHFLELRKNISSVSKRFCSEVTLPEFKKMVDFMVNHTD
jgi:glycosyltransferase involved in cell wall biosynthesis